MSEVPDFDAEIIIDEKGNVNVRNCNKDMIELLYKLNPYSPEIQKRIKLIQDLSLRKEK